MLAQTEHTLVSLVVPVFNEELSIRPFLSRTEKVFRQCTEQPGCRIKFEWVFVNDGSTDRTLEVLLQEQGVQPAIRIIDLSRNFGKEAALTAGIDAARGEAVIPIDADLQDPPELIIEMIQRWLCGDKVVLARRITRSEDSLIKRYTARLFYRVHNAISRTEIPDDVGDFRLMDRVVVDALKQLPENRRFMKGLFAWVGFKTSIVDYSRKGRHFGKTKFSGWSLWNLALEGITSFSAVPLLIWTYIGFFVSSCAFALALVVVVQRLFFGLAIPGYAALIVAVLFLGGVQLIGIGMLGEYLSRVYSEVKRRPVYIVGQRFESVP